MTLISCYFAKFDTLRGTMRKSGSQSHNYRQFTITTSSKKTSSEGPRDAHGMNII